MSDISTLERPSTTTTAAVPVTPDNFLRAESDLYFAGVAINENGFGKLFHNREAATLDRQFVIRLNRDTLYSGVVLDLDAGPATVTLPDAGGRFMSLQIIDEDQYTTGVYYDSEAHRLTREEIGTRYVLVGIRTLVDPNDPADLAQVHALQDTIRLEQPGGPGKFEIPQWDHGSQDQVRSALLALSKTMPDTSKGFGPRGQVDPVQRLVGGAMGWGANPQKDAMYFNITPPQNDGQAVYRLTVPKDVPVDGFWSISVYNEAGYYEPNPQNAYTFNNITAQKESDGSVVIQFGGCDGSATNCLPIMKGWNYMVRLYRPRPEVIDGSWKFPEAQPIG